MTPRAKAKSRVLVVDDHPIMRKGLRELIDAESDLEVCGQAETVYEAMRAAKALRPDLAIVDLSLKDDSGFSLVRSLRAKHPGLAVLVLSMLDENLYAERALKAGAKGYIMKEEAPEKLLLAIRRVLGGSVYLSENASALAQQRVRERLDTRPRSENDLSDQELEVFRRIGRGFSTKDIAARLHLSVKTVETYRSRIKKKLGLHTSMEMLQRALSWSNTEDYG